MGPYLGQGQTQQTMAHDKKHTKFQKMQPKQKLATLPYRHS